MWLLAGMSQTGMFLAGISLLIFLLMRRSFRYYGSRRSRKKTDEPYLVQTPRPAGKHRSLSTAPPDLLRWHVEMHETARDLKAELDSKMRLLQLLIAQARQQADRLEHLLSDATTSDTPSAASDAPHYVPSPSDVESATRLPGSPTGQAEIYALADEGRSSADIAQQVGTPLGEVELILSLRGARNSEA